MFRKFGRLLAFAILGCALIGAASVVQPALAGSGSGGGGGAKDLRLEGILLSVSSPAVTISIQNGARRTITIPTTAKIERNGRTASLAAFRTGDRVQARFAANGTTIVKFEGVGP